MKRNIFKFNILITLILLIVVNACNKEEENSNQIPSCKITAPTEGQKFEKGETVTISVEAIDSDGSITEVRFFINGIDKGTDDSFPFNYDWTTESESIGNHTLKATSIDNNGGSNSDEISIEIILLAGYFTDPRDGHTYKIVEIGSQIWMAENLNYDAVNGSWVYNNNSSNAATYGRLYDWETACDACPAGWHLPSDAEWKELEMYMGMSQSEADKTGLRGLNEGGKLKETGTTHWNSPNTGATNESGFSALPGGIRTSTGNFDYLSEYANFWTSTEDYHAWYRTLSSSNAAIDRDYYYKSFGRSVRCVRDDDEKLMN